ncbi:1-phosphofructokinase family hexose kinase [Amycolatopsis cihanbeyliensis]|uniref:Tagatose 6-phosphate kinase n=1 Tax=Amycolatopsis cihanbeyliensis TaxID=1128664 RepID=A0A542CUV2_AMYCI|nr:1-phosphofructokinase family hexose kinase [Amycolatopsis cihanbeyliensis]TQI94594.1 tagatose 6-phosphate kinase [Amycolatopsis cihanbeyliensis]
MILTVTPNTALDVTYTLERLVPDATHRALAVRSRAGGKGMNVARVVRAAGGEACAVGTAGGAEAALLGADLTAAGLPHELVPIGGSTRRTVTLISTVDSTTTLVNEPGPELAPAEWATLTGTVRRLLPAAGALVCAGSLPPGAGGYTDLLALAGDLPTILDTSGAALTAALPARPTVVKPNAAELREVTGHNDPVAAAHRLRAAGARAVVVSLGADGLLAVTAEGAWHARPSRPLTGNPTGAGDAAVAGMALELAAGSAWPRVLRRAVALSAAAVLGPLAGDVDLEHYQREYEAVIIEEDHATGSDS